MMSFLVNLNFRKKIIIAGIASIIFTVAVILTVVILQIRVYERDAEAKIDELTAANLQNITQSTYHLVEAQNEAVQQQVNANLNVANDLLKRTGMVALGQDKEAWVVTNQITQQSTEISLPKLYAGSYGVGHNTDPNVPSPVVDEIVGLVGGTATIFQRMDDAGDMLRVETNVLGTDGKRAVGTFIPAVNPDGTPNPVIAAVMKGENYQGLAFVVNAWYIATYRPLIDYNNTVIGMLYVGVRQESILALREAIQQTKAGKTGRIYVLNGLNDARGRYVISPDGTQDNKNIWDLQDADGAYPVRAMIEKALALGPEEVATQRYRWQEAGATAPRWKVNQITYFKPWDWVIVSEVYEDELLAYQKTLIDGHNRLMQVSAFTGLGILVLVGLFCSIFALSLTRPLDHLTGVAARIASGDLSLTAQAHGKDEIGVLGRAFNDMTARLRKSLSAEKAQRLRLESTVQVYVEHMQRVEQGDLQARVALDGKARDASEQPGPQDALLELGEQLNAMTASLQRMIDQIHEAAGELSSASAEILAVTIQQASGAGEQSAAIAETTSTVEMVRAIADHAARRVQEVADASAHTVTVSQVGQQAVQDTVLSMT